MEELYKEIFHKIVDELAEKGRVEVEIRGIQSAQGEKIHNIELILKDKADECEFDSLKERVTIIEQELKAKNKSKVAIIGIMGTIGAAAIYGVIELIKNLINK